MIINFNLNKMRTITMKAKKYKQSSSPLATVGKIMIDQADYVDEIGLSNKTIIESSGFKATSGTSSRKPVPAVPGLPIVKNENGQLTLHIDTMEYATRISGLYLLGRLFEFSTSNGQMWAEKPGDFIVIPAGTVRESIRGLVPGTPITVQVLAHNSAGKSNFTMPVSTFAVKS